MLRPIRIMHPLVDNAPNTVTVAGATIGNGAAPVLIGGPCAVESADQIEQVAALVASAGGRLLRGGAFKPRTSPYSFQGLGEPGLRLLREAASRHGLGVVTEAMSDADAPLVAEYADMIQVGSRTMHAYANLKAIGRVGKPVLLKRGMAATIDEWLHAAEYLLEAGAAGVVLCERGIRTFETATRNTLDLGAVAYLLETARLPIIVDPSHAAGRRDIIPRLARAALAVGAHGLMLEVHPSPGDAKSDGEQALEPDTFRALAQELFGKRAP